eukprot:15443391-Alexandrium_andersonii.AAC.1
MPPDCIERIERSSLAVKLIAQHIGRGLVVGNAWLGVDSLQHQRVLSQPSDLPAASLPLPRALASQ